MPVMGGKTPDIQSAFKEASGFVQNYPLLKKASSSASADVPGYVYEEVVTLTFRSATDAVQVVDYLASRLSRPSKEGRLRTLKTLRYAAKKGSRAFRKRLREKDEILKKFEDGAIQQDLLTGASGAIEIRDIAKEIRLHIFNEAVLESDQSQAPEVAPVMASSLSGLGSSGSAGKYEGFGNSPINNVSVTDRVLDVIERALSPTDQRKEVMNMCLTSSTGEYEAIKVEVGSYERPEPVMSTARVKTRRSSATKHVPGRAGGGWESSSASEDEESQASMTSELSRSVHPVSQSTGLIADSPEFAPFEELLNLPSLPSSKAIRGKITGCETSAVLQEVNKCLSNMEDLSHHQITILLLIVESLLRRQDFKVILGSDQFKQRLVEIKDSSPDPILALKTEKVQVIMERLTV